MPWVLWVALAPRHATPFCARHLPRYLLEDPLLLVRSAFRKKESLDWRLKVVGCYTFRVLSVLVVR